MNDADASRSLVEFADVPELLDPRVVVTSWAVIPRVDGPIATPSWLAMWLRSDADVGLGLAAPDDALRRLVRDALRARGFKPTGRSKPSSEYLRNAAAAGALPSIQPMVDLGNAISLHSGLPISVVDLDRAVRPLKLAVADTGVSYVFHASGQTIDVGGLPCLFDADGPCANAVKDAQRTKVDGSTVRTLTIVWAPRGAAARADATIERLRSAIVALQTGTEP